jgi:hypothetical protein
LQVLVKIREKPESRTTSGSFAKDAEKEVYKKNLYCCLSLPGRGNSRIAPATYTFVEINRTSWDK